MHRQWTVFVLCRWFIPRSELRLDFQDLCDLFRFVNGWFGLKGRLSLADFDGSCWILGRFYVDR